MQLLTMSWSLQTDESKQVFKKDKNEQNVKALVYMPGSENDPQHDCSLESIHGTSEPKKSAERKHSWTGQGLVLRAIGAV